MVLWFWGVATLHPSAGPSSDICEPNNKTSLFHKKGGLPEIDLGQTVSKTITDTKQQSIMLPIGPNSPEARIAPLYPIQYTNVGAYLVYIRTHVNDSNLLLIELKQRFMIDYNATHM